MILQEVKTTVFKIDSKLSTIEWVGRKIAGGHKGSIAISEGFLNSENGRLSGGELVIDMKSIKVLDVSDPNANNQLTGHLASPDFFNSTNHPQTVLVIQSVEQGEENSHRIVGDLTIKSITQPIEFLVQVSINGDTIVANGKIFIDRTRYGIKFRSGNFFRDLGDSLIYNEFQLDVRITAKAIS